MWFLLFVNTVFGTTADNVRADKIWVKNFIAPRGANEETIQKECEWKICFDWHKGEQHIINDMVYFRIDKKWKLESLRAELRSAQTILDQEGNEVKLFVNVEEEQSPGHWKQIQGDFFRGIFMRNKEITKEPSSSGNIFRETYVTQWFVDFALSGSKLGMLEMHSNANKEEIQKEIYKKFGVEYWIFSIDQQDKRIRVVQRDTFPISVVEVDGYNHMQTLHELFRVHSETTFQDLLEGVSFTHWYGRSWTRYDIKFQGPFSDLTEEEREENLLGKEISGEQLIKMKVMEVFPEIRGQPNRQLFIQCLRIDLLPGGGGY